LTSHFARLRQDACFATWFGEVFTLHYLLGQIFVLAPAKTIKALGHLVGIISKPWQVPCSEWDTHYSSPLFLLWSRWHINVQSWVRISKKGVSYYGNFAFVMGLAKTTNALVVAVVLCIRTPGHNASETKRGKMSV
jgi:hypothetical protein